MVAFSMWYEALILFLVFAAIVLIPCFLVMMLGLKMINKLALYPSKTPIISLEIFVPLVLIEFISFAVMIGFYNIFSE